MGTSKAWAALTDAGLDIEFVADESFRIGKAIQEHVTNASMMEGREIDVSSRIVALLLVAAATAQNGGMSQKVFIGTAALAFGAADESPIPTIGDDAN